LAFTAWLRCQRGDPVSRARVEPHQHRLALPKALEYARDGVVKPAFRSTAMASAQTKVTFSVVCTGGKLPVLDRDLIGGELVERFIAGSKLKCRPAAPKLGAVRWQQSHVSRVVVFDRAFTDGRLRVGGRGGASIEVGPCLVRAERSTHGHSHRR